MCGLEKRLDLDYFCQIRTQTNRQNCWLGFLRDGGGSLPTAPPRRRSWSSCFLSRGHEGTRDAPGVLPPPTPPPIDGHVHRNDSSHCNQHHGLEKHITSKCKILKPLKKLLSRKKGPKLDFKSPQTYFCCSHLPWKNSSISSKQFVSPKSCSHLPEKNSQIIKRFLRRRFFFLKKKFCSHLPEKKWLNNQNLSSKKVFFFKILLSIAGKMVK